MEQGWRVELPVSQKPSALDVVHKDFSGYVAFWRDVAVEE